VASRPILAGNDSRFRAAVNRRHRDADDRVLREGDHDVGAVGHDVYVNMVGTATEGLTHVSDGASNGNRTPVGPPGIDKASLRERSGSDLCVAIDRARGWWEKHEHEPPSRREHQQECRSARNGPKVMVPCTRATRSHSFDCTQVSRRSGK